MQLPVGRNVHKRPIAAAPKHQRPAAVQEAINAADGARVPSGVELDWADKHFVGAEGVGAVAVVDDVERVDDVALRFGHFFAVWGVDITVVNQLLDWFAERQVAEVGKKLTPKANV